MDASYDNEGLARAFEALGRLDEAVEQARITEKIRLRLASDDPNDQRPRLGLADIREVLGSILSRRGQKLVAMEYLEQAIEARRGFVKATPDSPEDEFELARALAAAAGAYSRMGEVELGRKCAAEARTLFTRLNRRLSLAALDREVTPVTARSLPPASQ